MAPTSPATAVIGPLTVDVIDGDRRPGGAVTYAARIARALDERLAILTIGAPDADLSAFDGHDLALVEDNSLTFEFSGTGATRRLRMLGRPSQRLRGSALPSHWDRLTTLIFAPLLADDINIPSFDAVRGERRALLGQGLQRCLGPAEAIEHPRGPSQRLLPLLTADTSLFLAADEIGGWGDAEVPALARLCARVVVTEGADGATVHRSDRASLRVEAAPANVVDTTGAGDVFATAFMLALAAGAEDDAAAKLASVSAAVSIEQPGAAVISAAEIESRERPRTTTGAA